MRRLLAIGAVVVLGCGGGTEPDPVVSVTVTAPSSTLIVGQSLQLTATPANASGASLSGRRVTWNSQNDAIATVSSSGVVTGISEGAVRIDATVESTSGSIGLQVGFPYPNVAGSYAYAATFDAIPSDDANGIGIIAVAQADRTKPEIQLAPLINWVVGSSSFNFGSAHAATVTTSGG